MSPRPPSPDPRTNVTSVRLSDAEHAAATAAAEAEDIPAGVWMRQVINRASGYKPQRRPARRPAVTPHPDTPQP